MYRQMDVDEAHFDSASVRLVYLELAMHADRGGIVRMPQVELAPHCGLSPRMIAKAFASLANQGFLVRKGHGRYQVMTPTEQSQVSDSILSQMEQFVVACLVKIAPRTSDMQKLRRYVAQQFEIDAGELIIGECFDRLVASGRIFETTEPVQTADGVFYRTMLGVRVRPRPHQKGTSSQSSAVSVSGSNGSGR